MQGGEGNAAIAAGASFPRCAWSGDLPPRRVNARIRFRSDQYPFQPTTIDAIVSSGNGVVPFPIASGQFGITNLKKIKLQHQDDRQFHPVCGDSNCFSAMTSRLNCESEKSVHHQELVVELPSLNSPERMRRRWLVLSEFAKYAFFWPDKKKSCF